MSKPLKDPACETFAKLLAVGVAPAEAYTESGVGRALACSVSQALRDPEIAQRVVFLKANPLPSPESEQQVDVGKLDEAQIMGMLVKDRELARATGQASAAVRAAELMGKQKGMFIERRDVKMDIRHMIAVRLDEAIRRVDPKRLASPIVER